MKYLKSIAAITLSMSIAGCAVIGLSTKTLREDKDRRIKVFDRNISYCYDKAMEAINKWEAVPFHQLRARHIVAIHFENIYSGCIDTTEVGIFFKELGPNSTEITVSSLNHRLAGFVAECLFKYIDNPEAPTCALLTKKKDEPKIQYSRKL